MPFIADIVYDSGLSYADTNGTRLDICSAEPTTYGQATTTDALSLGNKTALNTGAPEAGTVDGRKVVIPAITDGTVTTATSNTATHWALTDGASVLIATGALTAGQVVTNGNTFTLDAIDVALRDAT